MPTVEGPEHRAGRLLFCCVFVCERVFPAMGSGWGEVVVGSSSARIAAIPSVSMWLTLPFPSLSVSSLADSRHC